jgi:hypothetical protein
MAKRHQSFLCKKCGLILHYLIDRGDGIPVEGWPPEPRIVRIVDPHSTNNQILCPDCGIANPYPFELADHVVRIVSPGDHLISMADVVADPWKLHEVAQIVRSYKSLGCSVFRCNTGEKPPSSRVPTRGCVGCCGPRLARPDSGPAPAWSIGSLPTLARKPV